MSAIRNVCVYCGSSDGADARFAEAAEELGRTLATEGVGLVYGGGGEGLMGRLARSTLAAGGYVTGIIPSFLIRKEHPLTAVQEMLVVDSMHERKQAMFDRADAFVALPGGVGTVEELVEQLTWAQLNRHTKPILIADIGGFWRPLLALLAHMRIEGFIREGFEARYMVAERMEDVLPMLRAAAERRASRRRAAGRGLSSQHVMAGPRPAATAWVYLRHRGAIVASASSCGSSAARRRFMTRWTLALALGGALCGFVVAPALAQSAQPMPTKLRPKTSEGASAVTVMVTNSRKADLVQLQATESGLVSWKKVLGALKSGSHAPAQLPRSLQLPRRLARNLQRRPVDGRVRRQCLRAKDAQPDRLKRGHPPARAEGRRASFTSRRTSLRRAPSR